jgi:ribosome-binding ATPase YchF (GTP1/OBG family)
MIMKISAFAIPEITLGKHNIKDEKLDQADKLVKAKKKTYAQVEIAAEAEALESDVILAPKDAKTDLVLRDLDFVETRLSRQPEEKEKTLLSKMKEALEKEEFISAIGLTAEDKELISGYGLLTIKPIVLVNKEELEDMGVLLVKVLAQSGFICFLTVGDKENRAWLIKKGTTAWEAAGAIHSDIQQGFIRAEIINFADFIQSGGETQAKQAGKMRLEQKEYIMQDGDLVNFRFNK